MPRLSIETDSFAHENPIPVATRIGPLVTSGIIPPFNPGTRDVPDDIDAQVANLFTHIGNALAEAGGTWDDVAKINFFANDPEARGKINPHWLERFPEPDSRPSRHTQITPNDAKPRVTCDFIAYIED